MEHGSLNASTLKGYHSKWDTWTAERAKANLSPWLYEEDGVDSAVRELTVFMASRCLVYKNQSQTVKGYLAAIKYFHKLYAGWELPTSHFRVVAVGNAIDRLHARAETKPLVRQPLTVPMIIAGRERAQTDAFRLVTWMGIALSYFLLCRASELWAYHNGLVHADFCLTRGNLVFFEGSCQLAWDERRRADRVEVTFRASKADQKRRGAIVTRERVMRDEEGGQMAEKIGALEILLNLLDVHPELGSTAPLMQSVKQGRWAVVSRSEATAALRDMARRVGENPTHFALHSGRIGGATQLAKQGASGVQIQRVGRWKSGAIMTYVRAGGEGANDVSRALLASC
ncbi:unnamed protein product [Ectocarpus sp. CCAP 1310/34]|nr:unnamed protein product [Ectocarpus sp. CCAP 1310/34]